MQGSLLAREQELAQREQALETQARQLTEREQAVAARAAALGESVALAREQLSAANRRADALGSSLQERDAECARLHARTELLEAAAADLRAKLDTAVVAQQTERAKLEERYAAAEARWLTEVDRARQLAKEAAKEHERQMKDLRSRIESLQTERDALRQELLETRSELKTANAVRMQLEERLRRRTGTDHQHPELQSKKTSRAQVQEVASVALPLGCCGDGGDPGVAI